MKKEFELNSSFLALDHDIDLYPFFFWKIYSQQDLMSIEIFLGCISLNSPNCLILVSKQGLNLSVWKIFFFWQGCPRKREWEEWEKKFLQSLVLDDNIHQFLALYLPRTLPKVPVGGLVVTKPKLKGKTFFVSWYCCVSKNLKTFWVTLYHHKPYHPCSLIEIFWAEKIIFHFTLALWYCCCGAKGIFFITMLDNNILRTSTK